MATMRIAQYADMLCQSLGYVIDDTKAMHGLYYMECRKEIFHFTLCEDSAFVSALNSDPFIVEEWNSVVEKFK